MKKGGIRVVDETGKIIQSPLRYKIIIQDNF